MASGTLLIGYGNPGRGDDGLGPAFAQRIAGRQLPGLGIEIDYQLTVEHALMVAGVERVVFADAALDAEGAFYFHPLAAAEDGSLGSHTMTPQAVLSLARLLYGAAPRGFILGLRGAEYGEVAEGLSDTALRSLDAAEPFFLGWHAAADA